MLLQNSLHEIEDRSMSQLIQEIEDNNDETYSVRAKDLGET